MKYKTDSAFAICGMGFVPDASGLVDVPEEIQSTEEFKDFAERNARSLSPVKPEKAVIPSAPKAE